MRFIIFTKANELSEAGTPPTPEQIEAVVSFNETLVKAGVAIAADGLLPSSYGKRFSFSGAGDDAVVITDGPFAETKELIAGYHIIDVASEAEAVEWVRRWPAAAFPQGLELELRRFFEMGDMEVDPEVAARIDAMHEQVADKS